MNQDQEQATTHWIVDDTTHPLASSLCGMSRPDRLVALLVDGLSMDEEGNFNPKAFAPGASDAVFAVIGREDADHAFNNLSSFLRGKRAAKSLVSQDCEAAVALWNLPDDKAAILVVDANKETLQVLQEAWEETARIQHFGAYEEGRVLASDRFDPIAALQGVPATSDVAEGLGMVRLPAPQPPTRQRRTPA